MSAFHPNRTLPPAPRGSMQPTTPGPPHRSLAVPVARPAQDTRHDLLHVAAVVDAGLNPGSDLRRKLLGRSDQPPERRLSAEARAALAHASAQSAAAAVVRGWARPTRFARRLTTPAAG